MKILLVHNYYQQYGGEDVVFESEKSLLEASENSVITYTADNKNIQSQIGLIGKILWNRNTYIDLKKIIGKSKPDVVHVHNILPQISPTVYYAAKSENIPVVQTIHNYRLLCPKGILYRNGNICEECLGKKLYLPGIIHKCYRNSYINTVALTSMLSLHKILKTWQNKIDIFIALTEFAKVKLMEGGIPENKIVVKPNFINYGNKPNKIKDNYALFVGRLSVEKGLRTLINTWQNVPYINLKIIGDGDLLEELKNNSTKNVEVLGRKNREEIFDYIQRANYLVFPSEWYEGFPVSIVEAFSYGLPVIASKLGSHAEIISDGKTGLLFEAGNVEDLRSKIKWAMEHKNEMEKMGLNARTEYEMKYTSEKNYEMLTDIYKLAINKSKSNYAG